MLDSKIEIFKHKLLKEDGRTLTWFHREYLPTTMRYNYFSYQLNGHKKTGIDEVIINAINKYLEDKWKYLNLVNY